MACAGKGRAIGERGRTRRWTSRFGHTASDDPWGKEQPRGAEGLDLLSLIPLVAMVALVTMVGLLVWLVQRPRGRTGAYQTGD